MSVAQILMSVPLIACSAWTCLGLCTVAALTRGSRALLPRALPGVTVLKPLAGSDPGLSENIESFFLQDHGDFELVFGARDASDPALEIVRALIARYPAVRARVVVHSGGNASNPKVDNLLGMLPTAVHDLLLVSDSNVRVPRHYVREMVSLIHQQADVGLVTSLCRGTGERSLGAALDSVQMNGFCAAGLSLPSVLGKAAVLGKSMLFSRRALARLGGLERTEHLLAEDFVLGKLYQYAGMRVVIAPTVLDHHVERLDVGAFLQRNLRWSMLRWRLSPLLALLEVTTFPLVLLPLACVLLGPWGLAWVAVHWAIRDAGGWLVLRGFSGFYRPILLAPLRDLLLLFVWAVAPFKRHLSWRGHRVRLAMGTLLFVEDRSSRS